MAARFYRINDPGLSEYCFHVMRLCPPEIRSKLNRIELAHFKDEKTLRRFTESATLDQLLLMLSRIGIGFSIVVAPHEVDMDSIMQGTVSQYRAVASRKDIIKAMAEKKVFVVSSRDILVMSHMMAQNSHSQVYTLDYTYVELHDKLDNYRIRPFKKEVKDAVDGFDDLAKLTLNAITSQDSIQSISGVTEFEMSILLAMYPHRQTMIKNDRISELIGESYRSTGVAKSAGELEKKGYLFREAGFRGKHRSQAYMIGEKGIEAVLNYLKFIAKKSFQ